MNFKIERAHPATSTMDGNNYQGTLKISEHQRQPGSTRKRSGASAVPASRFPCGGARSGLTWGEGGKRGLGRPLSPAAETPCCTQPRLPTEARPCLSRRFPFGVSATASAASGAVYTVGPRTPPPPPLPPSLHPSAVADSAAATSSAAASSLWSIFQPPNPEKQRLQPRRQETPPQLLRGPGGQSTGGFSAIEQQPLRSFCNPLPAPCPPRPSASPAPGSHPLGRCSLLLHPVG
ncbi:verprolin-like [Eumetopias jubatus]|uniref:verprolin-like n=1 Tax=Eumetopias jubatus TaxID=34886 RepID=UPI001016DF09|nr:verprolin-like [Eumetopias jubatus]